MVDQLIFAALAWLHIFFAVCWLGGGTLFVFVIGPAVAKLSPPTSGEFFKKVIPKVLRFFQIMPTLTILFGLILLYVFINGDFSTLSLMNSWSLKIIIGMATGFVAFLSGEIVAVPNFQKGITMIGQPRSDGSQGPPTELLKTLKKARLASALSVILLIVTLIFMVGSAFY
jgi:uncharacterized membrane protein